MGFGLLLIGYFFANVMSSYSMLAVGMLAGYPLMCYALRRLAPYHSRFLTAFYLSFVGFPFALYFSGDAVRQWFGAQWLFYAGSYEIVSLVYFVFTLIFDFFVLYAVAGLADELSLRSAQSAAWRNMIFMALYGVFGLIGQLPITWIRENYIYFGMPATVLRVVFWLLNMWLLFQCYRQIASEEEEFGGMKLGAAEDEDVETGEEETK